jgi:hypothetical protein
MAATTGHFVLVRLREKIQPIDRGDRYEDPLDELLSERSLGSVVGGGTQMGSTGEIEFADIELSLNDMDTSVDHVVQKLEEFGAPAGSEIIFDESSGREPRKFGTLEAVGVYLDGTSLPDSVYAESDVNELIDELQNAVAEIGELRSFWDGPEETALYFYGSSADSLFNAIEPVLKRFPLAQNARVVVGMDHPSRPSKEVRMPRTE